MELKTLEHIKQKPWNKLKFGSSQQNFTSFLSFVRQGINKIDQNGNPIAEKDAEYMVAIGTYALQSELADIQKHLTTNPVNPNILKSASELIKNNEKASNEYVERLKTLNNIENQRQTGLPKDQLFLWQLVETRRKVLGYFNSSGR